MKSTESYTAVAGRSPGASAQEWLEDLVDTYSDERVAIAIDEDGLAGQPVEKMLGRVRKRLAREDAMRRPIGRSAPIELNRNQLMDIVRGKVDRPDGAFIWDSRDLTLEEYQETVIWAAHRREKKASG